MKIAVITNSRIPSLTANSIQAMKVTQALLQLGHDLRMFAPRETESPTPEQLRAHYGLNLVPDLSLIPSNPRLKRLDFILRAQSAARRFGAGLVYTWLPQSAALAVWSGFPVVLEMHADVAGRMGAWWLRQFWQARGTKVMTVTTSALKKALERSTRLEFRPEQGRRTVIVAPNGVELEKYDGLPNPAEARRQLHLPEGQTVGFTGHIYPGRGADLLFELAQRMPQVHFLWVGGTPELVEFWRAKLTEAGMTNVTMTGFVEHARIPLYQAAADVLLMPYSRSISASSGQDIAEVINPMKMFEYMASGRAIVSADLPSIREVLHEGNAVLCEAGEAGIGNRESGIGNRRPEVLEGWKMAIEALLADGPRRQSLAAQARADVASLTWEKREERALGSFKK
jgi:glycosyltransferase involved in cell wall biosynthesis